MKIVSLRKFPFVFVADKAFALKLFMLRSFPRSNDLNLHKLIFNYRLSRARQGIENTFGILTSRFRIFRSIISKTGNIKNITKTAGILHNFLMRQSTTNISCPPDYVDQETLQGLSPGSWCYEATKTQGLIDWRAQSSNNSARPAKEVRNDSKDYFSSEYGKLSCRKENVRSATSLFDEVD